MHVLCVAAGGGDVCWGWLTLGENVLSVGVGGGGGQESPKSKVSSNAFFQLAGHEIAFVSSGVLRWRMGDIQIVLQMFLVMCGSNWTEGPVRIQDLQNRGFPGFSKN